MSSKKPENNQEPSFFPKRGLIFAFLMFITVGLLLMLDSPMVTGHKIVTYSELKTHIQAGDVKDVLIQDQVIIATPVDSYTEKAEGKTEEEKADAKEGEADFKAWRSSLVKDDESLIPLLEANGVKYDARYSSGCASETAFWFLPLLLLLLLWPWIMRRMSGPDGANPAANFGKTNAKLNLEKVTGVTFSDVAGCDEAKEELGEIVHFLAEPDKYTRLGGKVPKGVLLVGPPGTGKTLLARAVAGEAGVPFFNLSGSDFVEMFVGVGAARVRDLFAQATKHAPCIIFVDELDAIGKSRGNAIQSNEEREQTLNALLVEMDGFDSNTNVIILAATNRPEVLDPALLRAGRFDRQVVVDRPDVKGRLEILKVHARKVKMDPSVSLQTLADQTPGFVGADLANVVNEAALLAARNGKDHVELSDFNEAIERVIGGLEKKTRRLSPKEKNIVAYHESGHAIVTKALEAGERVHKVSIVSRGAAALGYTLQVPIEDRYLMTKRELYARICGLLGGRAAEDIMFDDISTGASNDLQRVTNIARRIVTDYGMSGNLGNVSYSDSTDTYLGQMGASSRQYSEETAVAIDREVRSIIDAMYERTLNILRENRELLVEMSEHLKDVEVLDGEELEALLGRVRVYKHLEGTDGSPA
ncbi:ATP-dependent zinc metalloprotease FtsH [Microvenator marinus]|uniref:ATP-dependent zinc metalloprotease FtsH n=1 Tax=Microvenator marinus TaxID=2600177 RepID=A0A5B8XL95_9DELT|nr:ATP-dependent zinc metalloprotease FtsH [Microvenator marinus]QED26394.1 ATP-dependent zinc metalloprotease FtsH [Microvenator marinus]